MRKMLLESGLVEYYKNINRKSITISTIEKYKEKCVIIFYIVK